MKEQIHNYRLEKIIEALDFVKDELKNINIIYLIEKIEDNYKNIRIDKLIVRYNINTNSCMQGFEFDSQNHVNDDEKYYNNFYERFKNFFGVDLYKLIKDKITLNSNLNLLDEL